MFGAVRAFFGWAQPRPAWYGSLPLGPVVTTNPPPNPEPTAAAHVEAEHAGVQGGAQVNETPTVRESEPDQVESTADPSGAPFDGATGEADPTNVKPSASSDEPWLRGSSPRRLRLVDKRLQIALGLQVIIAAVVFGFWLLGKLSWNHDPLVSQKWRPLELPALTNRAQNAALEFHHDLVTGEFGQARLLVVEEAEKLVDDAVAACQPDAPCASKERVFTRATLIRSVGQEARALVESFAADGRPVGQGTYVLSHTSGRWLVSERVSQ